MTILDDKPVARTVLRVEPAVSTEVDEPKIASVTTAAISRVLIVLALLIAWVLSYLFLFSQFEQARTQKALYTQLRSELAEGVAPIAPPVKAGAPIAVIDAPGAAIHRVVVVEGTSSSDLQDGPGHLRGSVLPGQVGTSVLLGRALSFGGPFGSVHSLQAGDAITVTTGQGRFVYKVQDVRRKGDPAPPALAANTSRLTLVTAGGSGAFGALSPSATVYVDALLSGKAQPSAGVAPQVTDEAPMSNDASTTTLTELVLALQLFIVVLLAVAWAKARWSPLATWIAGTPLIMAALWLLTGVAARLLPNLM